jgi:hypothetical protein
MQCVLLQQKRKGAEAMGLWNTPQRMTPELDALLSDVKANLPSPEDFNRRWAEYLKTHCEHGALLTDHCPWCYIQTPAYRQSLANGMWTMLD